MRNKFLLGEAPWEPQVAATGGLCFAGGESSSQQSGQSSSQETSSSTTTPVEMNATTGNLLPTEQQLAAVTNSIGGGSGLGGMVGQVLNALGLTTNASGNSINGFTGNSAGGTDATSNPFVAPVTSAQNNTLGNIASAENGNYGFNSPLAAIMAQLQGEATNPTSFANSVVNASPTASTLAAESAPNFATNYATGGAVQNMITQAEQPVQTAFNTQTVPGLQASFAGAGQRAGGTGSSAFDEAFGNAQAQELATEAGTASGITENALGVGAGIQNNATNQLTGLYGTGLNIAANAPTQYSGLSSSELNDLVTSLNSQALPQLTEQLGINNALAQYNTSTSAILQALGLQVQGETPAIGYDNTATSQGSSQGSSQGTSQSVNFSLGLPNSG